MYQLLEVSCMRPDIITYIVEMLDRYMSNPRLEYWKGVKRIIRYLQRTKDFMLMYQRSDHMEISGYSDADFTRCLELFDICKEPKTSCSCIRDLIIWRSVDIQMQILQDAQIVGGPFKDIFYVVQRVMFQKNIKQMLIATSTMEEKFIAYYEASNYGI